MTPTILVRDGKPFLALGSPGGRKILDAVLLTILNVVDFGMNVQEAVDARASTTSGCRTGSSTKNGVYRRTRERCWPRGGTC
jgi:gamma-glutamyltranspeptidase